MKTLLLDDNLLTQTRIAAQLQSVGCEVLTRHAWPENAEFGLILINLGSRSLPGLELLQSAKTYCPDAILWAFCGHLEIEIRRRALHIGLHKLLTNEVAMSDLGAQLRTAGVV